MKKQEETLYLKMHKYVPKLQSHKTCDSSHQWTGKICKQKKLAMRMVMNNALTFTLPFFLGGGGGGEIGELQLRKLFSAFRN